MTEIKNFIIFTCLYFIQGIPLGLWSSTFMILLLGNGVSSSNLALLSLTIYPFSFKILTAPLMDSYWIKQFGKRKTYIIPIQYMICLVYFILFYSNISVWMDNIILLTIIGFLLVFLAAHQDIAVDGWVLTAFTSNHLGATAQSIGQMIGGIFSTTIFITLNSKEFCNKYINNIPKEQGILTLELFFLFNAIYVFLLTIYIQYFVKENVISESQEQIQSHSLKKVIFNILKLFKDNNLQKLFLHLLIFRLSFQPILTTTSQLLIAQGMKKEMIAYIQTLMIPISLGIIFIVGKIVKKGNEMIIFFDFLLFRIVESTIVFIVYKLYPHILIQENIYSYLYLILLGITNNFFSTCIFINHGTLFNRISDPNIGATQLTLLNSIHNLGGALTESISMLLLSFLSYDLIAIITICYGILYLLFMKKILTKVKLD